MEFLASRGPSQAILRMSPKTTHGSGDIVTIGAPTRYVQVLRSNGQPAAQAEVLVRDEEATLHLERRYKTDNSGRVRIELVGKPTIVTVVFDGSLVSQAVSDTGSATIRFPTRLDP
jgi:hypothetical protein